MKTECEHLYNCKNTKSCNKRHPKRCKRYSSEKCRFEHGCAYKHQKPPVNEDHEDLKEKVKDLEKVLHAMTRKVLSLETQVEALKEEKSETKDATFNEKCLKSSTPKVKKDKEVKKDDYKDEKFNCKQCNYSCKK